MRKAVLLYAVIGMFLSIVEDCKARQDGEEGLHAAVGIFIIFLWPIWLLGW